MYEKYKRTRVETNIAESEWINLFHYLSLFSMQLLNDIEHYLINFTLLYNFPAARQAHSSFLLPVSYNRTTGP